jgi:hypothetical protein
MMDPESLIEFVLRERDAEIEERRVRDFLSRETLVERGEAVEGLMVVRASQGEVWMTCPANDSRLRPGSRLVLEAAGKRVTADLIELGDGGRNFRLRPSKNQASLPRGPWFATEAGIDLTPLLVQTLKKLQPGAPGWSFFRAIAGDEPGVEYPRRVADREARRNVVTQVINDASAAIDRSQEESILACVGQPTIMAIQGPPGTGKTLVLALVAESLSRLGRRVLITAPTHQAVNNALATIHRLFPGRPVVKVGDELRRESLPDDIECKLLKSAVRSVPPRTSGDLITGMTFLSALQHLALRTSGLAPNVVLIDEAGQLPLAQGTCAGLLGAGSIVLFGDDAQMPPVFASDLADDPCAISIFRRIREVRPGAIRMLDTTYRMNDQLCQAISLAFYTDAVTPLKAADVAAGRRFSLPGNHGLPEESLVGSVLDSPSSFVWVKTGGVHARQSNPTEAKFIAGLVLATLRGGLTSGQVAVVTPFRRQAALIRAMIQSSLGNPADPVPIVDTVERVQGLTVELVAVSLCSSAPEYANEVSRFLFSPNRLNVAMSRATTKVVLAAAPSLLEIIPDDYEGLKARQRFSSVLDLAGASFDLVAGLSSEGQ